MIEFTPDERKAVLMAVKQVKVGVEGALFLLALASAVQKIEADQPAPPPDRSASDKAEAPN